MVVIESMTFGILAQGSHFFVEGSHRAFEKLYSQITFGDGTLANSARL